MTELTTTTLGLFPLPDWAKRELEDLKGHQKHDLISGDEGEQITAVYRRARREVIDVQEGAGLDHIVEGQLRWDDMLAHPLTVHSSVETRGIVRYYDNNNFYREPVVTEALEFDGDIADELKTAQAYTEGITGVLPGPYTLFDLATDEYYGSEAEFFDAITDFLTEEAAAFPEIETLILPEPSLGTKTPAEEVQSQLTDALSQLTGAVDAPTAVIPYWGQPTPEVYTAILDSDVTAVGFDLVTTPEQHTLVSEYGATDQIFLGVVDGQNTRVESSEEIHSEIQTFIDHGGIDPTEVVVGPNTELYYLPTNRCEEKLTVLGKLTERTEVKA